MKLLRSLMAGIGLLVTACDEIPTSTEMGVPHTSAGAVFNAAAQQGPIWVEVLGQPFTDGRKLNPESVAQAVQGAFSLPFLKFTGDRARAAQTDVRLIWVVDPATSLTAEAACEGRPSFSATRQSNRVDLRAYLCHGQRPLHAVRGHVRRPKDEADARWRMLIGQMSRQLIGIG